MNMLSKMLPEGSQSQSSTDIHSTPILLSMRTITGSAAASSSLDLDFLIGKTMKTGSSGTTSGPGGGGDGGRNRSCASSDVLNGSLVNGSGTDDSMVDLSEDVIEVCREESTTSGPGSSTEQNYRLAEAFVSASARQGSEEDAAKMQVSEPSSHSAAANSGCTSAVQSPARRVEVKPLTDISVALESIRPGSVPPLTVLDQKNGITVILNFGKDGPRPDVSVIVVTTISKNSSPISNYLFQAVVPKTCKLRLQPPSGSDLPAHNPFLPPAAITQVMLIANPNKDPVSLKFMVSFTMDDETVTEMGEAENLPLSA
ncbi:hypothetical protein B7P43_G17364 [Cryptotermes secundus]|uniref:GAE domain-containing protein n=1 Tax=Cryptotermes secundus TaxID=105785 RepID=A0A2J7Q6G0_9NEOP|nr:ADP-ribosylation factor-binding protein GGA1 [Cryptotermes secundus]PNF24162.1 hypothetical protein B7P43_G17364 [Cryptotermes secundus]